MRDPKEGIAYLRRRYHGDADILAVCDAAERSMDDAKDAMRGYAKLGIGAYRIDHSAKGNPPELCITLATEHDKATRTVGDSIDNVPGEEIAAKDMLVRLEFANVEGFKALMAQLELLRSVHFPDESPDDAKDADIKAMVNRFLTWPLPKTFSPDCGISFDGRKDDEWNKNKSWPIGTNLFTADEARAMFEHAMASANARDAKDAARWRWALRSKHVTVSMAIPGQLTPDQANALVDEAIAAEKREGK